MNARRRSLTLNLGLGAFALVWSAYMCRADAPRPSAPAQDTQPIVMPQPQDDSTRPNGSLWSRTSRGLTEDVKAHRVGDTVTVIVQETATASSTAATKTSRADSVDFNGVTGSLSGLLQPLGIKKSLLGPFGVSNKTSTDGQGQTNRSGSLVTRLTAIVKEILPNGNLVIEGSREVGVNAEHQKVIVSGVIRPQDVNPDNTVSSVALANATIRYDGKGPVGDKQRKGLLTTIFGWLF